MVNELLMQFQSDLLGVPVVRPKVIETTALGAAYAAGLAVGFWGSEEAIRTNWAEGKRWEPECRQGPRVAVRPLETSSDPDVRLGAWQRDRGMVEPRRHRVGDRDMTGSPSSRSGIHCANVSRTCRRSSPERRVRPLYAHPRLRNVRQWWRSWPVRAGNSSPTSPTMTKWSATSSISWEYFLGISVRGTPRAQDRS